MSARLVGAGGLVLALVLFFAVNSLSGALFSSARIDLTENRIYTLSEGTRATLANLAEPLTLRFYYSKSLAAQAPGINTYAARVLGLLEEYAREAGGKLTLEAIDPEPFSEEEDRAVGYGVRGFPARAGEGQELLYFGLVGTNTVDDEEVIPYFSPLRERFLEYDLTRMIHSLTHPERPVVGVLGTLPVFGMSSPYQTPDTVPVPWAVVEQMQQTLDVRQIDPGASFEEEIDVLMLVHPQGFDPALLYRIDQFVLGGGRALVFIDPHAESQPATMMGGVSEPDRRSDAGPLLAAWGVELEEDTVVGDLSIAPTVQMEKAGRPVHFDYPVWLNVPPLLMDSADIVTGELGNVTLGSAGVLRAAEGATTRFLPLIQTSEHAKRYSQSAVGVLSDPEALLDGYAPEGERFTLAARISGPARSAYPAGPPPPRRCAGGGSGCAGAPWRVRGRHQSHRGGGCRCARGPFLGAGAEPARHALHGAHRRQRHAGPQRAGQPHRLERAHRRAQPRHFPAALRTHQRAAPGGGGAFSGEGGEARAAPGRDRGAAARARRDQAGRGRPPALRRSAGRVGPLPRGAPGDPRRAP